MTKRFSHTNDGYQITTAAPVPDSTADSAVTGNATSDSTVHNAITNSSAVSDSVTLNCVTGNFPASDFSGASRSGTEATSENNAFLSEAQNDMIRLAAASAEAGIFRSLILSRPAPQSPLKIKYSLRQQNQEQIIARETFTRDGKNLQSLLRLPEFADSLALAFSGFSQINLLTAEGDAEYRITKKGAEVTLGADKLTRKLSSAASGSPLTPAEAVPLFRRKNYLLSAEEPFLCELGVTDENHRIHDKMQGKFRQINRFLEYVKDILPALPEKKIVVHDLCCGKSYLSFAVYHYLHNLLGHEVEMLGVDLKADVIDFCNDVARRCGFDGMTFLCGDIREIDYLSAPDLVISLHACDIATDIVLDHAAESGAKVILSTPCCQRELSTKLNCPALAFIADYPILKSKFCAIATDALRLKKLEAQGYEVRATELTDPDDTPKNVLLMAIRRPDFIPSSPAALRLRGEYAALKVFLTGRDTP